MLFCIPFLELWVWLAGGALVRSRPIFGLIATASTFWILFRVMLQFWVLFQFYFDEALFLGCYEIYASRGLLRASTYYCVAVDLVLLWFLPVSVILYFDRSSGLGREFSADWFCIMVGAGCLLRME